MKMLYKTLLLSALLATPFAAANAHETQAAHEAWIKAQKIDVPPTLTVRKTTIPASEAGAASSSMPSGSTMSGNANTGKSGDDS